ncbi:sodium:proton exchanger [Candidatus Uhrbacteria bacterium]|jgi:Kef-type K+ transport system membrane component KefB|nr:sodium:proton exchanger [Candidatus Uhrbacteria bacterium]MBT7717229.1 sodium:proton exchanger [Candidatus Uhrbacteria bacterium]
MEDLLFFEIAIVIVTAGLLSFIARILRQPLIIAYIVTGLLVGPAIFGFAESSEVFDVLAKIGIAFLLFLVGLHLNWRNIKDVGKIAVFSGLGQVIVTSAAGFGISYLLGFGFMEALFMGIAFSFSSTIIIVKLLSDKQDIDRFYGRISVGILIVQDLIAMLILLGLGAFSQGSGSIYVIVGISLLKLLVVLIVLWFMARYVLPHVFKTAARSGEQLFLIAIAWCFALASGLTFFGFGIETGALLAGIALAGTGFRREIESRIRPLRDFFLILFFIFLGTQLPIDTIMSSLPIALAISAFILIGNPLIVIFVLRVFGYHPRTGFLSGVTMAQVSEFSFILLTAAIAADLVGMEALSIATIVAMITITISSYAIKYNEEIYEKIEPLFGWLEHVPNKKDHKKRKATPPVVLFGCHDMGTSILESIKATKKDFLVIDLDPVVIDDLEQEQIPHMYGDMANRDFLNYIQAEKAELVISTIPDVSANKDMMEYLQFKKSKASVVVTAKTVDDAKKLYKAGATFVMVPGLMSGELFSQMLKSKKLKKNSWLASAKKHKWAVE